MLKTITALVLTVCLLFAPFVKAAPNQGNEAQAAIALAIAHMSFVNERNKKTEEEKPVVIPPIRISTTAPVMYIQQFPQTPMMHPVYTGPAMYNQFRPMPMFMGSSPVPFMMPSGSVCGPSGCFR